MNQAVRDALQLLSTPLPASHKGQNGKLLIIGGSELFHAASKWSLDVASRLVDMVFYSSAQSNNELLKEAKHSFWNGIIVPRGELESYVVEADCILIGPGMERATRRDLGLPPGDQSYWRRPLSPEEWEQDTERIINYLLATYPEKKWVVDAGALQMVDPMLLTRNCIVTPHAAELHGVLERTTFEQLENQGVTILAKGPVDSLYVVHESSALGSENQNSEYQKIEIAGGHPGMTKGGTGDVLAGLVAGLFCLHDARTSAIVASYVNKRAGEVLAERVGPYFNASDLADQVPETLWSCIADPQL